MPRAKLNPRNEYPESIVKEAVRLRTVEKQTLSEIARQLDLSRASVTTLLDRQGLGSSKRGKHPVPKEPEPLSFEQLLDSYLASPIGKGNEALQAVRNRK